MNMISTGTFLPEMDASNKQETLAEKFAAVWEKKNSKAARAGGVSLMALSLAACGSSSDTTTAVEEPAVEEPVVEEPTTPVTPAPTVNTITKALLDFASGDTLAGTDGDDVLDIEMNTDLGATTTISGIETISMTSLGNTTVNFTKITDVAKFEASESTGTITLAAVADAAMILGFEGSGTNNITAGYKAGALSGASDTLNIELNGAKAVTVSVDAGFEDISINTGSSTGSAGQAAVAKSDIDSLTTPGVTKMTITGEGALDLANAVVNGSTSIDASAMGGALTTGAANATTGFAGGTIVGASGGTTVLTGSGNDNIGFQSASATKGNTVKLGAGDDLILVNAAGAGAVVVMGEGGDDHIRIATSTVTTADVLSGGAGDDTVTVAVAGANGLLLRDVENVTLTSAATGAQTFTADEAVAVSAQTDGGAVNVANLSAGSTVSVAKAKSTSTAATDVTVDFLAVEAASTVTLGGGTSGDITVTDVADLTITADDAVDSNGKTIAADDTDTTKLTLNLEEVSNSGGTAMLIENISAVTDLTITASKAATFSAIGGTSGMEAMKTMTVTGEKAVTLGAIGLDSTATAMETLTVSGKGAVSVGELHDVTSLATYSVTSSPVGVGDLTVEAIDETNKLATVSLTAAKGAVNVNEIGATGVGTAAGTFTVSAYDEINLDEAVFWNNADGSSISLTSTNKGGIFDNSAGNNVSVTNELGDLSATLSTGGKAEATFAVSAAKGVVTVDATGVTGGSAITVNNGSGTAITTDTSAVTLGAAKSGTTNALTVDGDTDVMNVTGGSGNDTVAFAGTDDHMTSGTFALGGGSADAVDFANIVGALSATSEGVVVNLSNSAVTFDSGETYSTSIAANTAAEYSDAGGTAKDVSTTDFSVVLSGVEKVTGTANADYFVAGNTGVTIIGGDGIDTIDLGAGADTVEVAAIAIAGSVAGADVISNFTVGSGGDVIRALDSTFAFANGSTDGTVVLATGVDLDAAHTANNNYTVGTVSTNVATHTLATYAAGTSTLAELEGAIGAALADTATADHASDVLLAAVDDGTATFICLITDGGTDDLVAAELSILAVLEDVADATTLTADNFAFA